jgi:putative transposase
MKKRFTEERIIGILKEAEAGMKVAEVCRTYGISEATYSPGSVWRSRQTLLCLGEELLR